jgi:hypothetical protein
MNAMPFNYFWNSFLVIEVLEVAGSAPHGLDISGIHISESSTFTGP